jgi:hypothetical protein
MKGLKRAREDESKDENEELEDDSVSEASP